MFTATPFAGLEFASLNTGAFTENNQGLPSVIGLSYASTTTTLLPSFALRRRRASSPYSAASRIAP